VLQRYAGHGGETAFGDWAATAGAEAIATWLPEPVVRRRGARSEPAAT
jgi:hypothetical protein